MEINNLTASQREALKKIKSFSESTDKIFILTGSAGTGKTTLLNILQSELAKEKKNVIAAAPTGRAAQVLRSKGLIGAQTIHRTIYSPEKPSPKFEDEDVVYYFRIKDKHLYANTIFLIDESSMISNIGSDSEILKFGSGSLLDDLLYFALADKSNKIIFSGDTNQLPPINMQISPALDKKYFENLPASLQVQEYELKDIVRQKKQSSIIATASLLKDGIEKEDYRFIKIHYSDDILQQSLNSIALNFTEDFNKHKDETILIAHTNAQVYRYNQLIRERLFESTDELNENERLLVVTNNYKYDLLNGEMIKIKKVLSSSQRVSVTPRGSDNAIVLFFKNVLIERVDENGVKIEIECLILENLLDSDQPALTKDERRALIVYFQQRHPHLKRGEQDYFTAFLADPYANALHVKYGYAVTCHKAQGGEWDIVYFDFFTRNLGRYSKEYFRFCYTAITRSKKKLKLINVPKQSLFVEEKKNTAFDNQTILEEKKDSQLSFSNFNDAISLIEKEFKIKLISKDLYFRKRFLFEYKGENKKFDIIYNGKNKITGIASTDLKGELRPLHDKLKELEGSLISEGNNFPQIDFEGLPKLADIYNEIKTKLSTTDIEIIKVEHHYYLERYTFKKKAQITEVDINYNKKYIVTSFRAAHGSENKLFAEIRDLLYAK